ncbi:hypothetical protein DIPPA_29803 [Diplonema papillatum]|nr:hypothetical protein DIPPA_29803 [Diplonema papillatum]
MLAVLCRLCETLKLPSPLPTARLERVKSLHTLGVPRVIGGLQVRPVFAAGAETAAVLEACATRALPVGGLTSQVWGRDVFPQYDSALRAERAQQWEVRRPVLTRSAHPVLVPASQAMTRGRFQVCDKCAKKKCPLCASSSQRTPEQCCRDHHEPGDGVLTQCCGAHHLTRCGGCANTSANDTKAPGSGWVLVEKRRGPLPQLRPEDWPVPVVTADDVRKPETTQGVALVTWADAIELAKKGTRKGRLAVVVLGARRREAGGVETAVATRRGLRTEVRPAVLLQLGDELVGTLLRKTCAPLPPADEHRVSVVVARRYTGGAEAVAAASGASIPQASHAPPPNAGKGGKKGKKGGKAGKPQPVEHDVQRPDEARAKLEKEVLELRAQNAGMCRRMEELGTLVEALRAQLQAQAGAPQKTTSPSPKRQAPEEPGKVKKRPRSQTKSKSRSPEPPKQPPSKTTRTLKQMGFGSTAPARK